MHILVFASVKQTKQDTTVQHIGPKLYFSWCTCKVAITKNGVGEKQETV